MTAPASLGLPLGAHICTQTPPHHDGFAFTQHMHNACTPHRSLQARSQQPRHPLLPRPRAGPLCQLHCCIAEDE